MEAYSKDYGAFSPFKVRAGLRSYTILRDPTHISRVLNASEHLTATESKNEVTRKLFGSPRAKENTHFNKPVLELTSLLFSDATLAVTTDAYISLFSTNMHDKMFQYDTWTRIEDLWSFLQLVLLRCTLDALFGSKLLKQYPRMVRDYREFDAAIEGFIPGMPRSMISGASKSRDRMDQGLKGWLTTLKLDHYANHSSDATVAGGSTWSETTGLEFIRERYRACKVSDDEQVNLKARVAEVLGLIHTYVAPPL